MTQLEQYRESLIAYENGEPIMPDAEFDVLKQELIESGEITDQVGSGLNAEHKHRSIMLSMKKIVTSDDFNQEHIDGILKWFHNYDGSIDENSEVDLGWKFDGVAFSGNYDDGILSQVLTRSSSTDGEDVYLKVKHLIPNALSMPFNGEIRGEIFMRPSTFLEKYSDDYENTRNIVPGILKSLDVNDERKNDLSVVMFEGRDEMETQFVNSGIINLVGDSKNVITTERIKIKDLHTKFYEYLKTRNNQEFPTDGLVIRLSDSKLKHNGHYPYNACCIKFKPVMTEAIVKEVKVHLRKSGKFIPKAYIEPTLLDGTTIRHINLYSYDFMMRHKIFPGAKITIGKNGDIIPVWQETLIPGDKSKLELPPEEFYTIEGAHMHATPGNDIVKAEKFNCAMHALNLDGFGGSSFWKLAKVYNYDFIEILNPENRSYERIAQVLNGDHTIKKFINAMDSVKSLSYAEILYMMSIDQCGWSHCKDIANWFRKLPHTFKGRNKSVVKLVTEEMYHTVKFNFQLIESYGIKLYDWKDAELADITFEMTGSPKPLFKTKDEFTQTVHNWSHTALKSGTTYLVTDKPDSTTGKMAKAKKLGIEIITYEQAIELHK